MFTENARIGAKEARGKEIEERSGPRQGIHEGGLVVGGGQQEKEAAVSRGACTNGLLRSHSRPASPTCSGYVLSACLRDSTTSAGS